MAHTQEAAAKIFSTRGSEALAQEIAKAYGSELGKMQFTNFSDGEFSVSFEETVRGRRVFIVGSTSQPSDNLMEMLLMIDAAKRASAKHITAVIPYFGWARQDRKDRPRVPIGAKLVAKLIEEAGATRLMTMDLHADQIQGFFEIPVDHLYASSIFLPFIKTLNSEDLALASPDMGGSKRAHSYAKYFGVDVVICYKQRAKANVIESMTAIGDIEGKDIFLVDDMIDTAGTIAKAADMMIEKGAKSVRAAITHPVLSGSAYDRIQNSKIEKLYVTDSIPTKRTSDKIEVLSCAQLFAAAMQNVHQHESISSHFII